MGTRTKTGTRAGREGRADQTGQADQADQAEAGGAGAGAGVKSFVLDTNVLLHNPEALFSFKEHNVVIPLAVVEELDRFKRGNDDLARNARQCIRRLDALRKKGRLNEGVRWGDPRYDKAGLIRIDTTEPERPSILKDGGADNRIIAVAYELHQRGEHAVFISKDMNARIKSDALGIQTEDFEAQKVDADRLYTGFLTVDVAGEMIDELYDQRMLPVKTLDPFLASEDAGVRFTREISSNEFVVLHDAQDESHSGLARRLSDTDHLIPVSASRRPTYGVLARNTEQTMALDLLLDDDLRLVTLTGGPGAGKTLLALASGMQKVFKEERFDKLLVARPIMPMGRDIGYLPGEKEEKLAAWMQPIFDNLEYLLSTRGAPGQQAESRTVEQRLEALLADGRLVLEALTYIRGRSIPHVFMIVDEAQNLTPHEVKTIISRAGEGTKIVLTGDIEQIDNPYLDMSSNGLSYGVERMKGVGLVGHVTMRKSERSELASLAADRL